MLAVSASCQASCQSQLLEQAVSASRQQSKLSEQFVRASYQSKLLCYYFNLFHTNLSDSVMNKGPPESPGQEFAGIIEQISTSVIFRIPNGWVIKAGPLCSPHWFRHSSLDMILEFATCSSTGRYFSGKVK